MDKKTQFSFFKLFSMYFWVGMFLILLSIIIDLLYPNSGQGRGFILSAFINLLLSVGSSIFIVSIFTFAAGSIDFISKISKYLEDIVIGRNFLSNIDSASKRETIKALIKPTSNELNTLPNIDDYYEYSIENTLSVSTKNVRSNYNINAKVHFSDKENKIISEGLYSYRLYPSEKGFNPIILGFHETEDSDSFCEYLHIDNSKGNRKIIKKDKIEFKDAQQNKKAYEFDLTKDEISKDQKHLDIEMKVIEKGDERHLLFEFTALQPTNGFRFKLECEPGLKIKKYSVFIVNASHFEDLSEDGRELSITCNQWINEGTGLCVSILKEV